MTLKIKVKITCYKNPTGLTAKAYDQLTLKLQVTFRKV